MGVALALLLGSLATISPRLVQGDDLSDNGCSPSSCLVRGFELEYSEPYEILTGSEWYTWEYCGVRCSTDRKCKTFAIGQGTCRLYHEVLRNAMREEPQPSGPFEFSNACCAKPNHYLHPNPYSRDSSSGVEQSRSPTTKSSDVSTPIPSSSQESSSPSPSISVNRVLRPMRDPSIDRSDASNLNPASSLTLFYTEPGSGTYTMTTKAAFASGDKGILLENIGAVSGLTCSSSSILIDFEEPAFAALATSWPAGTILMTLSDGCNADDERGVYIISEVQPPPSNRRARAARNVVTFTVVKTTLQEVVYELDISYGQLVSASDGKQITSYTTTITSYFTHSRAGTLTSSIFVSTITPTLTTATYTSRATPKSPSGSSTGSSSAQKVSSTTHSSSVDNTASSVSPSFSLSPSAEAILEDLTTGLPAPGPDGTITVPMKKGNDPVAVIEPVGTEPYSADPAYQAGLQNAMAADHLDSPEALIADATDALADITESNIAADSPVKLTSSEYTGTDDAVYDAATPVVVTTRSGNDKRNSPARVDSAPAPHTAISSLNIDQLSPRHSLSKRDGWDTFFNIMGNDLVGEICELCGAISAGKDLYDAMKCIFGSCPKPPQVTITTLEGKTSQEFKLNSRLSKGGLLYSDSRATVLCADCYIEVTSLKIEGNVKVRPKQINVKENFVVSAAFTVTQSSVSSVLYNIRVNGASSGSFDRALSTFKLDSVTAPGVVTISPKFLYGLGLTFETAQSVDVQAGGVITLSNAAADIDIKAQTASNARNWQPAAQVTFPKLTQPGRVVLSPYLKTDTQISLTIFGQYLDNAIVLTSQTNLGFDAEVLTSSQPIARRTEDTQAKYIDPSGLDRRQFSSSIMKAINAAIAANAARLAGIQLALGKPIPKPAPVCNIGSMKLNAIMNSKSQAIVGGKPNVLFSQPYKFGSQCLLFAAPSSSITSTTTKSTSSLTSSTAIIKSLSSVQQSSPTPSVISLPSLIRFSSTQTSTQSYSSVVSFRPIQSSPTASVSACVEQNLGFYPPAGSSCFKVVGHGLPLIEGKYLNMMGLGWRDTPASVFYLDSNGYMYESSRGAVMATDRTGGGAWISFTMPQYAANMPKAICTKNMTTRALSCFQTSTSIITIGSNFSPDDSRNVLPMFGFPDQGFKQISFTYEDVVCSASCSRSTTVPTSLPTSTSLTPTISSMQPSATPQCKDSLTFVAPAGSTCFTLTGHGPSHVEGQLLGMAPGYSGPAFGWDQFKPATFYRDLDGYIFVVSEIGNGWVMATLPIDGYSPWMDFFPPQGLDAGRPYPRAVCTLSPEDKSFHCSLNGLDTWHIAPNKLFYSAQDSRSGIPIFGLASGPWVPMTLNYNEVACPVKCEVSASASPSLDIQVPSSITRSQSSFVSVIQTSASSFTSSLTSSYPSSYTSSYIPSLNSSYTPSFTSSSTSLVISSSASPSATPEPMQPCGGFSPGGNNIISGSTYSVFCGTTGSPPITRLDVILLPSFKACMASCNVKTSCKAVMFREIAPIDGNYQCTRYSTMGLPQDDGLDWTDTFDVAYKIKSGTPT